MNMLSELVAVIAIGGILLRTGEARALERQPLFPTVLPGKEWVHFKARGFAEPVCGVIYRRGDVLTNGMALGGIDTGCLDLESSGLLGYCTLFNTHVPRRGPLNLPLLGMSVNGQTWVLCDPAQVKQGEGSAQKNPVEPVLSNLNLDGVRTVRQIHYWGHYPVADLEFEPEDEAGPCPLSVGMRAWAPFLPGDVTASMCPAIAFEVHCRNHSDQPQPTTLAVSFPGPTRNEADAAHFERTSLKGKVSGVHVAGRLASYCLGVVGPHRARSGGELGADGPSWARISQALPACRPEEPGSSVAVDLVIPPRQVKIVRFILAWNAPTWKGGGYNWAPAGNVFTHMYAKHYPDAADAAQHLASHYSSLLKRVLAWQQVVYTEDRLPVWLRDSLINVLYMITEDGYWAQARDPLPDWVKPEDGLWGMNECPRGCPQIECIPCSFYGSLPLTYFFPTLQLSTIRGYKGYQYEDGAPPWIFGGCTGKTPPIDFAAPTRGYQFASNGISLAAIVDRFLLCRDRPDRTYLNEFYPMIKKCMTWTLNLRTTPGYSMGDRVVSMPNPDSNESLKPPTEWFEAAEPGWRGLTAHIGGLHLAQLRITERMARDTGDIEFAKQCAEWIRAGVQAMEERLWTGSYYLNYFAPDTGERSDFVFGYQLDGEWIIAHHGLPRALPEERTRTVLETVKRCNIAITKYGAVNYANPDGTPIRKPKAGVWDYGQFSYFPPEALMLAMNYMYEGQKAFGIELARRVWHNLVCLQGYTWDMPNIIRGDVDTGERTFGNDYYQDMMLWALPAAIAGEDVSGPTKPGGLVDRILKAASAAPPPRRENP